MCYHIILLKLLSNFKFRSSKHQIVSKHHNCLISSRKPDQQYTYTSNDDNNQKKVDLLESCGNMKDNILLILFNNKISVIQCDSD